MAADVISLNAYLSQHSTYAEWFNNEPELINKHSDPKQMIDPRIVDIFEYVRTQVVKGACYISSGYRSCEHNQRLKLQGYKPGHYSQHLMGRAVDFSCNINSREVRRKILAEFDITKNYEDIKEAVKLEVPKLDNPLNHIRGIEMGITWVHLDCRWSDKLILFPS